jgi:hypothetical protein
LFNKQANKLVVLDKEKTNNHTTTILAAQKPRIAYAKDCSFKFKKAGSMS